MKEKIEKTFFDDLTKFISNNKVAIFIIFVLLSVCIYLLVNPNTNQIDHTDKLVDYATEPENESTILSLAGTSDSTDDLESNIIEQLNSNNEETPDKPLKEIPEQSPDKTADEIVKDDLIELYKRGPNKGKPKPKKKRKKKSDITN